MLQPTPAMPHYQVALLPSLTQQAPPSALPAPPSHLASGGRDTRRISGNTYRRAVRQSCHLFAPQPPPDF